MMIIKGIHGPQESSHVWRSVHVTADRIVGRLYQVQIDDLEEENESCEQ